MPLDDASKIAGEGAKKVSEFGKMSMFATLLLRFTLASSLSFLYTMVNCLQILNIYGYTALKQPSNVLMLLD